MNRAIRFLLYLQLDFFRKFISGTGECFPASIKVSVLWRAYGRT